MIKGEALLGRRQVSQVLDEASLNRKEIKKSYKRNEVSMLLHQPKIILIPKKHILGVTNSALSTTCEKSSKKGRVSYHLIPYHRFLACSIFKYFFAFLLGDNWYVT